MSNMVSTGVKRSRQIPWILCAIASAGSASVLAQTTAGTTEHVAHTNRIRYVGHCPTIDGQGTFIRSAGFHYFCVPRALRADRFRKIKEAGCDTVSTHVPWNQHERQMPAGLNNYSKVDLSEVKARLDMARHGIPWRLLFNASGNDSMLLSGHSLGRQWEIGPQRGFFLPECWLRLGRGQTNVLVLGLCQTIHGAEVHAAEVARYPDSAEENPGEDTMQ